MLNIWRLGEVRDTKFAKNLSNKMSLNIENCQGYSFYRVLVIKGKQQSVKLTPPPRLVLKWRKNTENINPKVSKTNNDKIMLLLKSAKCSNKRSRFI